MTIFTFEKISQAYEKCRKNKNTADSTVAFEINREKNLYALYEELKSREYQVSPYIHFVIENPTAREIFASDFRDRIVHHLLCTEIQHFFEREFLSNTYANIKGRGTHKAVDRLEKLMQRHSESFAIKLDIQSFFRTIDKDILIRILKEKITSLDKPDWWKEEISYLLNLIVYNDPRVNAEYRGLESKKQLIPFAKSLRSAETTKGLPIGNLTSQFFANVYLDAMDKYIVRTLGLHNYVRYVDDFVIIHDDPKVLKSAEGEINRFLKEKRGLQLHPKKTKLQQVYKGIDFLGYVVKPTYRIARRRVVGRAKVALQRISDVDAGLPVVNSYWGHFLKARTYRLRKHLFERYLSEYFTTESYNIIKSKEICTD